MRPEPFIPETTDGDKRYVRDKVSDLIWHRCKHRTLYADTDRSQVVYHATYLQYFELGRGALMRDAAYSYRSIEAGGNIYPVIEIGVKYYTPLHYDDSMWVHTRPAKLERVRLRFDYIITSEETGAIICKGHTRHCALNQLGKPTGIEPKMMHLWEVFPS